MNLSNHLTYPFFKVLSRLSKQMNMSAYVIGGFVRDIMLERPCKDIDIVILGSGVEMAKALSKEIKSSEVSYFKNFGTAMLKHQDIEIEFVGARKESYKRNSRKPIVEDGTLEDDQNRRDFTINALAISLNEGNYGELIDPFNGLVDLENKVIRTPLNPDQTYSDDPLRMMRAIRFATQLNFFIEKKSFDSIAKNKERISIVSMERITTELNKIILSKKPSIGFKLLNSTGLLDIIFPELAAMRGVEEKNGVRHKDNFFHTIQVLDNISSRTNDLWLRWAAILHDIAKPATKRFDSRVGWTFYGHEEMGARMTEKIFSRLKLPKDQKMKFVKKMVALHLRPIALTNENATDSAVRRLIFDTRDDLEDLLTLCRSDITSKNPKKVKLFLENYDKVEERIKEVEERDSIRNWQPPISGEEIMKTFNIKPCREVGMIKNAIKEAMLEGKIKGEEEARAFMLLKGKEIGLKTLLNKK